MVENHWYRLVSELSHPRGKEAGVDTHQLLFIIVKAAPEGVKSFVLSWGSIDHDPSPEKGLRQCCRCP